MRELYELFDYDKYEKMEGQECLHEQLERSKPVNQRGGAHMLVCNCPKCRTMC